MIRSPGATLDSTYRGEPATGPSAAPTLRCGVSVTLGEAAVLTAIALVTAVAWLSLALAHVGAHQATLAAAVPTTLLAALLVGAWRRGFRFRFDGGEIALLAVLVAASVVLFFPGFPYAAGDKDPGLYVAHAFSIERDGSYAYHDPTMDPDLPVNASRQSVRHPGVWVDDPATGRIVPQFFHLYPAALATALGLFGPAALFSFNAVVATLAVLAVALATRRVFGSVAAIIASGLLITNMIEVWHARYPTTEILTQMLLVGALLAVVVAHQSGRLVPATFAGLLVGVTFLARPDGFLIILVALCGCGACLALGRFDRRAAWFLVGLAVALPHAVLQAENLAGPYARANSVPGFPRLVGLFLAPLLAGLVLRWVGTRPTVRTWANRVRQRAFDRVVAATAAVAVGLGLLFGLFRESFLGQTYDLWGGVPVRSYNEDNVRRLVWFFTPLGIVGVWFGFAVVVLRRWSAGAALLLAPGVLVPLYLWQARVSSRLMWWTRRFVPVAIVILVILIAVGLAWLMARRRPALARWAGVAAFAYLILSQATMSLPLRDHREYDGTYELGQRLAALAGDRPGVFLWTPPRSSLDPAYMLGGPLALLHGQYSAVLPRDATIEDVEAFATEFPGQSVFVLAPGTSLPDALVGGGLARSLHVNTSAPVWEESDIARPDEPRRLHFDFAAWRYTG